MLRVLTAALTAGLVLTGAASQAAEPTWVQAPPVPLPRDATDSVLRDVTVISPTDVWAVGWMGEGFRTLAARWDGAAWTRVPTPDSPDRFTVFNLNAIDAVATEDIWVVGGIHFLTSPNKGRPLFLHYDGIAWAEVPAVPGVNGELSDIDLLSAVEGWAVGTNMDKPFIMRRMAGGWESVPTPAFEGAAKLESVHTTSSNDAWAVGSQMRSGRRAALVLHWDGRSWMEVAVPDSLIRESSLTSVAAASASEVWAIGSQCSGPLCTRWVLHLTEGTWRSEPTAIGVELSSVVAFAPDDVWIFGQGTTPTTLLNHVEHWDGTRFTTDSNVPPATVDPHHPDSALSLAAASGDRQTRSVWAVGWIQGARRSTHAIYRVGASLP